DPTAMTAATSPAARTKGKPYVVTGPGSGSPVAVSAAASDSAPIAAAVTPASTATPVRTGQAAVRLTVGGAGGAGVMGSAYGVAAGHVGGKPPVAIGPQRCGV